MKQLLFILLLFVSKLLQAQQNEIPKEVKSIFEGLWECNNKYQSNKIKITFEPGKEYAIFNDIGNGMAPAKILHASMEKENLFVIPAVQYQNDYTEFKVERGNLYLMTRMITWDSAGNILSKGNLKTKIFKRVSPQKNISVSIAKITKSEFYQKKQRIVSNKPVEKITDFKIVKEKLKGIVEFEELDGYLTIKKINFRNGISTDASYQLDECSFSAYFPKEDILLLECGHTMDKSFDLKTGKDTYEVGNLNYVITSPSGKYRLNKIFEGQECFHHFIQEKENGSYKKILELNEPFEKETGKWLCLIEQEFWADDNTLYFGLVTKYKEDGNEHEFYKVNITKDNK